ncbi:MAG TPA: hypothetical protein VNN17_07450 [Terriglobia bacterium]|nr:hypothetical protein [Terriglobia bacterium]
MIFGFNTDVPAKEGIYHVQTEDRGAKNPVIESIVYVAGKILGKRRTPYDPAGIPRQQIEEMVRRQHKELVEAIRTGSWAPSGEPAPAKPATAPLAGYSIRLLNPRNLCQGDFLRFQLGVLDNGGNSAAPSVVLEVRWLLGGQVVEKQKLVSQSDGAAELLLPRPMEHQYGTLLISAQGPAGRQLAKFHVRCSGAA